MEFRLIYEGSLKGSGNASKQVKNKHSIRQQIHKQLVELWKTHPTLNQMNTFVRPPDPPPGEPLVGMKLSAAVRQGALGNHGLTYMRIRS